MMDFSQMLVIYTCCKKKELTHCAICMEYPCKKCATLKEFNCLNTNSAWLSTVSMIQSQGFEKLEFDGENK